MAENIDLAKYNIDTSSLTKDAENVRKRFEALKKEQRELRKEMRDLQKEGKDSGKEFDALNKKLVSTEIATKNAGAEYRSFQNAISTANVQAKEAILTQSELDAILNQEAVTIEQLRKQNTALNAVRDKTNLETEEGRKQLEQINVRLDQNNQIIKENVDSYARQKIGIGDYSEGIKTAVGDLGGLSSAIGGSNTAMGNSVKALSGVVSGWGAMTRASLAFLATPIGIVISTIAVALVGLQKVLSDSEEKMNKLKMATAPLSGILNALMDLFVPLGDILLDKIVVALDAVTSGFEKLIEVAIDAMRWLGLDSMADGLERFQENLEASIETSTELAKLNQDIVKAQREMKVSAAAYGAELERLKVLRDDANNSLEVRKKANEDINAIINEQYKEELRLVTMQLSSLEKEIELSGENADTLDRRADLTAKMIDLQKRADAERRRAVRRQASLERSIAKEESDRRKAIIKAMEEELDLNKALQEARENSFNENIKNLESIAEAEQAILLEKLKANEISEQAYNASIIRLNLKLNEDINRLRDERLEELKDVLHEEIQAYQDRNSEILESEKLLTEERLEQIKEANEAIFEANKEALDKQQKDGLLSEQEYQNELSRIKSEQRESDREAEKEFEAQKKAEDLEIAMIEFAEHLERLKEQGAIESEIKIEQIKEHNERELEALQNRLDNEEISQELFNAKVRQLNNNLLDAEIANEEFKAKMKETLRQQELDATNMLVSSITSLLGEQAGVSKALSGAMALINTYEGVTKALAQGGFSGIAQAIAVGAMGMKQVAEIYSTKLPVSGADSSGGDMGVSSASNFTIPEFVDNSESSINQENLENDNINEMADTIANRVEEATERGTRKGSSEGIENLSDNRNIINNSSY